MRKNYLLVLVMLLVVISGFPSMAQSREENVKNRICSQVNLDTDLVGVILYEEANTKLMLTFVYINKRTLQSNLKPDIKDAIRPYQNENAILVLATAAKGSANFNPYGISFSQHGFKYQVEQSNVIQITSDFGPGILKEKSISQGIVLLGGIDSSKKFRIAYKNSQHSTSIAVRTAPVPREERVTPPSSGRETRSNYFWGFIKYGFANFIWAFLLSFLVI